MCMACEEAEMYRRWQLLEIIASGQMPAGYSADDLRNMGLPQPGEVTAEEQPDGTIVIKQVAPKKANNAFVCDTPD